MNETPPEVESEPSYVAELFGGRADLARAYTSNLAARGEELGLIGPLELPRLWTRHIANSALVAPLLRPGRVGDIGSGAGLPGIVLAITRPDVNFVLIEPMERRVDWLRSQQSELGLDNVEVVRARAEEAGSSAGLDQVTARAVSALKKLLPMTAPLLRVGGEFVFLKGKRVAEEVAAADKVAKKFAITDLRVDILGSGLVPESEVTYVARGTLGRR